MTGREEESGAYFDKSTLIFSLDILEEFSGKKKKKLIQVSSKGDKAYCTQENMQYEIEVALMSSIWEKRYDLIYHS